MPIDPRLALQGQPLVPPRYDLGETLTTVARLQALDEQRRGQALYNRGAERQLARDDAWQAAMAQVFTPPQAAPSLSGSPPQGLTARPMADQVPFASPAQGQYGLTAPPPPQGMPPSFERAPSSLQAPAMIPGAPGQGLTAPSPPPSGPPPVGLGPGASAPPPASPPGGGLTAPQSARPSQFAQLIQPLNMEALQQAYQLEPEKTGQWHARQVQLQGQKIAQAEHVTDRMYTVLKRIVSSDTPQQAYTMGLKQLRDEGIPLPQDLPPTYDPAWGAFTLDSLRSAKMEQAELKLKQDQAELELKQYTAQTERGKMLNEAQKFQQTRGEGEYRDTPDGQVWVPKYAPPGGSVDARPVTLGGKPVGGPLQVQQEHQRAQLAQQGMQQGIQQGNQTRSAELQLQAHADTILKPYREVRDAMGRIEAAGTSPTAAGDLALITAFMKMLDPLTGVRDQEFKTAASTGGILDRVQAYYAQVASGKRLSDDVRKDFMDRSKTLYGQYMKDYEDTSTQFREQASRQRMDPRNVIQDYRSNTPAGGRGVPMTQGRPVTEMSPEELQAELNALRGKR